MPFGSKLPALVAILLASAMGACRTPAPTTTPEPAIEPVTKCPVPAAYTHPHPDIVAGHRVKGGPNVPLTDRSLVRLRANGVRATSALVQFCLDATGRVESVCFDRLTGDAEADATIQSAIRSWVFTPWQKAGVAIPACQIAALRYRIS